MITTRKAYKSGTTALICIGKGMEGRKIVCTDELTEQEIKDIIATKRLMQRWTLERAMGSKYANTSTKTLK